MSGADSANAFQGFSVYQSSLGAALQWLPAQGTQELDDLINSLLPGPSCIQDKRAHISMDFFEFARQTGQNFKFYQVPSVTSSLYATDSPVSTNMFEMGYNSNSSFNTSPGTSDTGSNWTCSPTAFSGGTMDENVRTMARHGAKPSVSSRSRKEAGDFTHHPGMRIMTKDGQDITDSASRGSKTKEQRDHAHLMRIIKACDSCKRKKTRCDPSHKKRLAAPPPVAETRTRSVKISKKTARKSPPTLPPRDASLPEPEYLPGVSADPAYGLETQLFDGTPGILDEPWEHFIGDESNSFVSRHVQHAPDEYDFFFDPQGHLSPQFNTAAAWLFDGSSMGSGLRDNPARSTGSLAGFVGSAKLISGTTAAARLHNSPPTGLPPGAPMLVEPRSELVLSARSPLEILDHTRRAGVVGMATGSPDGQPSITTTARDVPAPARSPDGRVAYASESSTIPASARSPDGLAAYASELDTISASARSPDGRVAYASELGIIPASERLPNQPVHARRAGASTVPTSLPDGLEAYAGGFCISPIFTDPSRKLVATSREAGAIPASAKSRDDVLSIHGYVPPSQLDHHATARRGVVAYLSTPSRLSSPFVPRTSAAARALLPKGLELSGLLRSPVRATDKFGETPSLCPSRETNASCSAAGFFGFLSILFLLLLCSSRWTGQKRWSVPSDTSHWVATSI